MVEIKQIRIIHALNRAMDRYGYMITLDEYNDLINQIQSHTSLFIKRLSSNRCIHYVKYEGKYIPVIYHSKSSLILTFMTGKWLKRVLR